MTSAEARWREVAMAGHTHDVATATEALIDPDPEVRQLALGALHRMGTLSIAQLAAGAADEHPGVRRRAAMLLASYPDGPVLPLLHDAEPTVVEAAAWAVGERVPAVIDDELEALIRLATDAPDALAREA
ncbi:MAG TPA: hypothetical protein DCR14_17365, partial [Acidimicrobiaceae bacterium]|nr:hypothetical protein [Acidimicrobiaceae bacterium]